MSVEVDVDVDGGGMCRLPRSLARPLKHHSRQPTVTSQERFERGSPDLLAS